MIMLCKVYKVLNDFKLTKNFMLHEFVCKDGSGELMIDLPSIELLQKLRDYFGKPVYITSAYRSPEYNKQVGGVKNSYHLQGRAFDIYIEGVTPSKVAEIAEKIGFTGIGIYDEFTHVDTRNIKSHWDSRHTDNKE